MQNESYATEQFSERFKKLTTIKEAQALGKLLDVNFSGEITSSKWGKWRKRNPGLFPNDLAHLIALFY